MKNFKTFNSLIQKFPIRNITFNSNFNAFNPKSFYSSYNTYMDKAKQYIMHKAALSVNPFYHTKWYQDFAYTPVTVKKQNFHILSNTTKTTDNKKKALASLKSNLSLYLTKISEILEENKDNPVKAQRIIEEQ